MIPLLLLAGTLLLGGGLLTREAPVACIQIVGVDCPEPSALPPLLMLVGLVLILAGLALWAIRG